MHLNLLKFPCLNKSNNIKIEVEVLQGEKLMLNSLVRTTRPLSNLSNFVVEELPIILSRVDSDITRILLTRKTKKLVEEIEQKPISDNIISLLDLTFLEAAFYTNYLEIPDKLISLTNIYASHFCILPMLTYELLIMINPSQDLRLFTLKETGENERLFYESHKKIEANITPLVTFILRILIEDKYDQESLIQLRTLVPNIKATVEQMLELMSQMSTSEYNIFRRYLTKHPIRGFPGASGAYSALYPTLDQLLRTEIAEVRFKEELLPQTQVTGMTNIVMYEKAKKWRIWNGQTMIAKLKNSDEPLKEDFIEVLNKIINAMVSFRQKHLCAVAKHIPQVFEGKECGTGGIKDAPDFLKKAIEQTKKSKIMWHT